MSDVFDPTVGALNTALNLRQLNANIINSNIANADTPGYKAKAVDFEDALRDALHINEDISMSRDEPDHMVPNELDPVNPVIYEQSNGVQSLDGNTVNRSLEMVKLAENEILYNSAIEAMKKKLGMLRYAVAEGGGNR